MYQYCSSDNCIKEGCRSYEECKGRLEGMSQGWEDDFGHPDYFSRIDRNLAIINESWGVFVKKLIRSDSFEFMKLDTLLSQLQSGTFIRDYEAMPASKRAAVIRTLMGILFHLCVVESSVLENGDGMNPAACGCLAFLSGIGRDPAVAGGVNMADLFGVIRWVYDVLWSRMDATARKEGLDLDSILDSVSDNAVLN